MVLISDKEVTPLDGLVYGVVYWFHSLKDGVCFASNPTIATLTHSSARGVQNSLTNLENRGYVRRFQGPKGRQIIPLITFKHAPVAHTNGAMADAVQCFYCGTSGEMGKTLTDDHYIPTSRGGSGAKENKVLCCRPCNEAKGDMTGDEYIAYLKHTGQVSPNKDRHQTVREGITKRGHRKSPNGDQNNNIDKENIGTHRADGAKGDPVTKESPLEAQIGEIIFRFKDYNPAYRQLFARKPQRDAAKRLLEQYGFDQLCGMVGYLRHSNAARYAPTITTPVQLESKLGELKAWADKQRAATGGKGKPIISSVA